MGSSSQSSECRFVGTMLNIYREAARLQYEEAEELIALGLAAKDHADALMARCADLVAETLDPDGEMDWPPEPEEGPPDMGSIPF